MFHLPLQIHHAPPIAVRANDERHFEGQWNEQENSSLGSWRRGQTASATPCRGEQASAILDSSEQHRERASTDQTRCERWPGTENDCCERVIGQNKVLRSPVQMVTAAIAARETWVIGKR